MADFETPGGLFASARRMLSSALELVEVRLELLAVEFEQEKLRLFDVLGLALVALLGLAIGILLLCAWVVWMVEPDQRRWVLAVLALGFLIAGGWAFRSARARLNEGDGLFRLSARELARDRERLGPDPAAADDAGA